MVVVVQCRYADNLNHLTSWVVTHIPGVLSVEYINGGVDPVQRDFSPGSVLSFVNTQTAWAESRALGKPLRYSFGRADREYKDRWCNRVPVYQV